MKGIKAHSSFRPDRCRATIDGTAVTVGAGAQMIDIYRELDALNQTIVGGGGKTVSVGGYITGAGHGLLSSRHGLAADQVLEMEVVTPKGDIVTANECQNQDLFWAMRGGGGSTFGVMTSVTMRTFPTPHITHLELAIVTLDINTPPRTVFDMVAYVVSQFPALGDSGLTGYSYFFPVGPNPIDGGATMAGGLAMGAVLLDSTPEEMNRLWEPVLRHVSAAWPGFLQIADTKTFPSFYAWFQENYDKTAAGNNGYIGSRLLGADHLTRDPNRTAAALERFTLGSLPYGTAYLVSGKGVHDAQPRGGGNAVLPAWRKAYIHASKQAAGPV